MFRKSWIFLVWLDSPVPFLFVGWPVRLLLVRPTSADWRPFGHPIPTTSVALSATNFCSATTFTSIHTSVPELARPASTFTSRSSWPSFSLQLLRTSVHTSLPSWPTSRPLQLFIPFPTRLHYCWSCSSHDNGILMGGRCPGGGETKMSLISPQKTLRSQYTRRHSNHFPHLGTYCWWSICVM